MEMKRAINIVYSRPLLTAETLKEACPVWRAAPHVLEPIPTDIPFGNSLRS